MSPDPPPRDAFESPVPHLSRRSFVFALLVTLAIFFLLHPMWEPLDMEDMDRNIAWSYAPIPLLVLALLALERKLRWSSWLLETLRLTFVKFAITFLFANILWSFVSPPGPVAPPPAADAPASSQAGRFEPRAAPPATPLDPGTAGRLTGRVVDAAGAPQAGVLVAARGGPPGIVFAPPAEPLRLAHDGSRLQPPVAVLQAFQPLVIGGVADRLHTVRATDTHGRLLFNVPLLPGAERTLMFDRAVGRVTLVCTVEGAAEPATELLVVDNPFLAWTGPDGAFALQGVPAGDWELTAPLAAPEGGSSVHATLAPGSAVDDLRLELP